MKIHVAHILVKHQFEAEDLQKRLERGEKFEDLAQKYSTCSSAARGGDLGQVEESRLDEDFAEAAKKLKTDEISKSVRTRFGFHLIKNLKK